MDITLYAIIALIMMAIFMVPNETAPLNYEYFKMKAGMPCVINTTRYEGISCDWDWKNRSNKPCEK